MTIPLSKDLGNLVRECSLGLDFQSTQILPNSSVVIFPNLGILTASIPVSVTLTWKLGSTEATRNVSRLILGYNFSSNLTTIGILRVTPSISGSVLTTPMPAALSFIILVLG